MLALGLVACLLWLKNSQPSSAATPPPNIVIILADDLGWNDVSFHGSDQFQTPNIDALAYSGVILHNYYTQPICTPSRAALLTGRHPISNGMEHDVIYAPQPWGLPLSERLMPQYLKAMGYATRAVGKWHLGFFKSAYTPTKRGFDSHYGMYLGHQNHYTHMGYEPHPGFDFRRDLEIFWKASGKYSVDLFTDEAEDIIQNHNVSQPLFLYLAHTAPHAPLQAPADLVDKFSYIKDNKRQVFAAMVTKLDESVGRVMQALKEKDMLNNTLVLFLSDNGGATHGFNGNVASNWPLRGGKDTLWEGGVRGAGLIWSPLLQSPSRVFHGLINVQDWLPTLLEAAGVRYLKENKDEYNFDGVSQWKALNGKAEPPYRTVLHNIDRQRNIAALRDGDWKIVKGRTYNGEYDGFYGQLTEKLPYSVDNVRESVAGRAVRYSPSPLPSDTLMLELRLQSTVNCRPMTLDFPHVIQVRQAQITEYEKTNKTTIEPTSTASPVPLDCKPHIAPCLFNLKEDPCETVNLASTYPEILSDLIALIDSYQPVPPNNQPEDPRSYPEHWNYTWTTWQDYLT